MDSTDKAWERFQAALKRDEGKALDASTRASKWLADGGDASGQRGESREMLREITVLA